MARKKPTKEGARLEVAESTKAYMLDGVRHVCENFKQRLPGSQSERDAQAFFKKELEGYADEVTMEDFTLHPGAFMGFIPVAAVMILAAVPCFLLSRGNIPLAVAGAVLPLLALLMFLFEFLFYREFVDFLFPKKVSRNVYAVRKPSGEVKRRIIFGGHTDAANEWTYSWLGEKAALGTVIFGAVVSMLLSLVANLVNAVYTVAGHVYRFGSADFASKWQGGWLVWSVLLLLTIPFALAIIKFINYKVVTDGANDNLSANYIAMAVLKEMHDSDVRLENTEVCALLTGSEEAGLRGAKAFALAHHETLSDPNVETIFVAMDTMREVEELRICNFGCTGTVYNDYAVGDLLRDAGKACGVDIPNSELYPGAVDSEAFSVYGLRANGFTGVSHDAKRYYHTRQDTPDNMDADCVTLSLNICKEATRIFDENGMAGYDAKRGT
ncbi:MAG: M28 family peptidase [Oscillospiraceae bacterium]|jgi:hypothetical protein|nr:M28 family peptidase [Oscillospiraceae bacterium]